MIIHTYLSLAERRRLRQSDHTYLKRKLQTNCMLSNLLHRPYNKMLLDELQCLLDRKPIARRKVEDRHSKCIITVVSAEVMDKLWR